MIRDFIEKVKRFIFERINKMNEKSYEEVISKDFSQNQMALSILLNSGKKTLLDDKAFKEAIKIAENREKVSGKVFLMTKEFEIDVLNTAKELAKLSDVEIFRFIKKEIPNYQKKSVNREER